MSTVPENLVEIKHIYDYIVSPGAYYFNKETHEIHSGKRYKYAQKDHHNRYWGSLSIKEIYPYNIDGLASDMTELITLSCKKSPSDKCKSITLDFDVLIKDILSESKKFLE